MLFPVVDISKAAHPAEQLQIAEQLTAACKEWGFFLLRGHSIQQAEIDEMFALGRTFFNLPEDEKTPFPITADNIGYMGSFQDRWKDDKMSMWFGGPLQDHQDDLPTFWRPLVPKVEVFKQKCHHLIIQLLEYFALALGLPDQQYFANAHRETQENVNSLRMLMYPIRLDRSMYSTTTSRMAPHTDSGSITLLFQKSAGLEVMSPQSDEWVKAPYYQDCVLVNIGDTLSFWSGRQLKATLHRVTFDTVPSSQERQTMAYFAGAHPNTVLKPLHPQPHAETYYSNGIELTPGMTVGQLRKLIMQNIYKKSMPKKPAEFDR